MLGAMVAKEAAEASVVPADVVPGAAAHAARAGGWLHHRVLGVALDYYQPDPPLSHAVDPCGVGKTN